MRRLLILFVFVLPLLAACGGEQPANPGNEYGAGAPAATEAPAVAETAGAAAPTGAPAAGTDELQVDRSRLAQELFFFTWTDYINPEVLAAFEQEYGVKVTVDVYDSNENMLPKIRAGNSGYDIVVPSDYAVKIMIQDKLIAPLDKSLLPNIKHLSETNLGLYFDPENAYSLPYFWGTTGIAYNKTVFETPPDSYAMFFDPAQLEQIKGQFTMLDDPREAPGAALIFQGQSVNSTDEAALAKAEELLLAQKPYVSAYDSSNVNLKLSTQEIVIAHAWNGMAAQAIMGIEDKPGNPDIAFVIPKEGGVIWQDNLAIVADSPNQYTAHVFINFLLRPEIAALNTNYVNYLTPNKDARELLAQATKDLFAAGIEPDAETVRRLQWIERNETTDTAFADLWTRVTGQ